MRFLNPKTDFAFKRIFGSEQSREILLSFLNAVLGLETPYRIVDLTILDPYLAPKIQGMKDTYLDVRARDEQEKWYIIEMQVLNVAGFEKRILYNACKAYAGQIKRGEDYHLLTDVIAITITDFVMFGELADIVTKFRLRAETGQMVYSDDLELVFAELPKFTKTEQELETVLDRWFYFLKYAGGLEAVPTSLQTEPTIVEAFDIANKAGLTPEELEDQERREIFIQDQRGAIMLAEQKGMEKGVKKGLEEGIKRGRDEEKLCIARALLDIMDDALIAEKTGLSADRVRQLRSETLNPVSPGS
jgi:predicted transposase/invertase (TIGR01784 family)